MRSGTQTSVFKNVLVIRELKAYFDHNFIWQWDFQTNFPLHVKRFIKTTDHRPTDPPTTYPPTYVKIEDQILNMLRIL